MKTLRLFLLVLFFIPSLANAQTDITHGTWFNEEKTGRIQFYMKGEKLFGKIVWLEKGDKKDSNNPDPALRDRAINGITNLTGFVKKDKKTWVDGKIYDPESGKTYSSRITLVSEKELDVRGYIGTPMLGRSTKFTKAD